MERTMRKLTRRQVLVTAGAAAVAMPSWAQGGYPQRPITLIVPAPPAGPTDLIGRLLGDALHASLGQPVVVDNRVGGNGNIGAQAVAGAAPDGYTLLLGHQALNALNPAIYRRLPFDARRDFAAISRIASQQNALCVPTASGITDLPGLLREARAHPGVLNFGSTGAGTASHLLGDIFKRAANVEITHIPYKGQSQAITALLAGEVQMMFASIPVAFPYIEAARLRPLMTAAQTRSRFLASVPSASESGLPDVKADVWFGLFAPARTPHAV